MARPKSGTKEGDLATIKWRKTMQMRYGDITKVMRETGRKGGLVSRGGGFATDIPCNCNLIEEPHRISECAGSVGGRKSRRGKANGNKEDA